jgi:hypothetical protein
MFKWVSFVLVLVFGAWAAWYFGIADAVGGVFDDWLKWIGAKKM